MRLLVDECSPNFLVEALRRQGHDVVAASATDPGDGDPSVLERSVREGRILVTVDRGFGSLVKYERRPAVGVVVVTLAQTKGLSRRRPQTSRSGSARWVKAGFSVASHSCRSTARDNGTCPLWRIEPSPSG